MRKWDGQPTSALEVQVYELQGKTITNKGKLLLQSPACCSSDRVEGLISLPILWRELLIHIYKNKVTRMRSEPMHATQTYLSVTNTMIRTRGDCLQAGGGKGQPGLLDSGFDDLAHQNPGSVRP